MKSKAAKKVGIEFEHIKLDDSIDEAELLSRVRKLNSDSRVHGILGTNSHCY